MWGLLDDVMDGLLDLFVGWWDRVGGNEKPLNDDAPDDAGLEPLK